MSRVDTTVCGFLHPDLTVNCEEPPGHDGPHQGNSNGHHYTWSQDRAAWTRYGAPPYDKGKLKEPVYGPSGHLGPIASQILATSPGGEHYRKMKIEPIVYIEENGIPFHEGNVIKYVTRWRDKNGVEDLRKARFYIDRLIELEESKKQEGPR